MTNLCFGLDAAAVTAVTAERTTRAAVPGARTTVG
jgi:hypothetical protein